MAIFSKPVKVTHTCYEVGHCWTPYCTKATIDVGKGVFTEALKIYGTLYLVAGILRKRGLKYYVKRYVPETLRSSIFLTINGAMFIAMFCVWRRLAGFYFLHNVLLCGPPVCVFAILFEHKKRNLMGGLYFVSTAFVPCYFGALMAILVERKPRRGPLAVYLTNLAIETGFRMMVERNLVTPIPNGEVYLFSIVSAIYLYLFRKKQEMSEQRGLEEDHPYTERKQNGLSSSAESLFRFFVGSAENPRKQQKDSIETVSEGDNQGNNNQTQKIQPAQPDNASTDASTSSGQSESSNSRRFRGGTSPQHPSLLVKLRKSLEELPVIGQGIKVLQIQFLSLMKVVESWPQHRCCQHDHSCVSYVLKGGSRMFAFGYAVQAIISTLSHIPAIIKRPGALKDNLVSIGNLRLAAFLGCYNAVFRAVNCLLRWIRDKDTAFNGFIAGGLAGLSLRFYQSVTIALYAATKLAEILYFKGIESHGLPYIKCADIFIYAFSCAFIFHAAVMEPHTLRPGYWKFLLRVTHNKFAYMNRQLLDPFGVNSSKLDPNHWPDYDPAFTSLARPKS